MGTGYQRELDTCIYTPKNPKSKNTPTVPRFPFPFPQPPQSRSPQPRTRHALTLTLAPHSPAAARSTRPPLPRVLASLWRSGRLPLPRIPASLRPPACPPLPRVLASLRPPPAPPRRPCMPAATTTTSGELVLFGTELSVDPGLAVDPGPAAEIPVSRRVQRTASSIVDQLCHPDSVSTPGRRPGAQRPPRRKMASPTASSSGTVSKDRLATPSPNR